jgi:nucleoside-diphosphate-sugar epimerase
MPKRKVLVTGGGGFLGGAIVRFLISEGESVRSFSRGHYSELEALGVEQLQGDLSDIEAVSSACQDIESVFHVAAKPGVWGRYETFYQPNVVGTENIINACRSCGVQRLIYTSSPSVVFDGNDMGGVDETVPYPPTYHAAYPQTKAVAEYKVLQAAKDGMHAVALRPHLIWGPGDNHLVPRIIQRAHRLRQVGDGGNLVDTIYIDNAALAHVLAERQLRSNPELSGRVYFISQDEPIALWEMVNRILAAAGKPPVKRCISPGKALLAGSILEMVYKLFGIKSEPPLTRFVARELATSHWFNIQAAKTDLGYKPVVSTEEGFKRLKEWLKNHPTGSER